MVADLVPVSQFNPRIAGSELFDESTDAPCIRGKPPQQQTTANAHRVRVTSVANASLGYRPTRPWIGSWLRPCEKQKATTHISIPDVIKLTVIFI